MDRRAFLDPRHLAQSAGHVVGALAEVEREEAAPVDRPLLHLGWRAMATSWEIIVPLGTPEATLAGQDCFEHLDELESRLTVFRSTSEVSRINAVAAHAEVAVAPDLFELLRESARIQRDTDGAFDITAGALIRAWGFLRGPRRVPSADELALAMRRTGMGRVALDDSRRGVSFGVPGLEFNLGAIGKGWSLDRLAGRLRERWRVASALLHGGRSSVYAIGCPPGEPGGWSVGLSHPERPEQRLACVRLRDRALGTSAATYRFLEHEGKKLGHVLDPRTGWPASGVASCSVLAPTAMEADALSTAFFILGESAATAYCKQHPQIGVLLLNEGSDQLIALGSVPELE